MIAPVDRRAAVPVIATLLAALLLGTGARAPASGMAVAAGILALIFVCALAPVMLTYPAEHVISDQIWTLAGLALAVAAAILCGALRILQMVAQKSGSAAGAARAIGGRRPAAAMAMSAGGGAAILILIGVLLALAATPSLNMVDAVYADCAAPKEPGPAATDYYNGQITYTYFASTECDGRQNCSFHADRGGGLNGALDQSCKRHLQLSWTCGPQGETHETKISLDRNRYRSPLSCH
jgi:hypothetical protein